MQKTYAENLQVLRSFRTDNNPGQIWIRACLEVLELGNITPTTHYVGPVKVIRVESKDIATAAHLMSRIQRDDKGFPDRDDKGVLKLKDAGHLKGSLDKVYPFLEE